MDFAYTEEDEAFRAELRAWLDENLPDFLEAGEIEDPQSSANLSRRMVRQKAWQRRMNEGRWAAINWPKDWGGREATIMQNVIYSEEMAKAKTPGIFNTNGIWQIGPMIIKWGTDEQKDMWLRGILNADEHWCQGFTDARVPVKYRLGAEGQGWLVAMGTLGHERVGTAGLSISMRTDLDNMIAATRKYNPEALDDPDLRDRIARVYTQLEFTRLLNARALSKVLKGEKTWPEVQLAKLQWSSLSQTLAELAVDLLGPAGLMGKGGPDAVDGGMWARNYVWQRYTSIGAGATEVQKNIIADRAIQLPRK